MKINLIQDDQAFSIQLTPESASEIDFLVQFYHEYEEANEYIEVSPLSEFRGKQLPFTFDV